jgi:hypothetical protein
MGKRVAIIQSNYIPWKGYFNIINNVDEFVLLDDVQYTRRDWRNRNLIKTAAGLKWLTVPVDVKGNYFVSIKDVQAVNNDWRADHWNNIREAYKKARYFDLYKDQFENEYLGSNEQNLSKINFNFIRLINFILDIKTPVRWAMEFDAPSGKSERLIHICKCLNADEYLSGPAAREYMDIVQFEQNNIQVRWADYSNYPVYTQLYPSFEHGVSIIDLLFNEGSNAIGYLKQTIL